MKGELSQDDRNYYQWHRCGEFIWPCLSAMYCMYGLCTGVYYIYLSQQSGSGTFCMPSAQTVPFFLLTSMGACGPWSRAAPNSALFSWFFGHATRESVTSRHERQRRGIRRVSTDSSVRAFFLPAPFPAINALLLLSSASLMALHVAAKPCVHCAALKSSSLTRQLRA